MKYLFLLVTLITMAGCLKSKNEYREAIQEIQREEEAPSESNQRSRGSNDREGMGADE